MAEEKNKQQEKPIEIQPEVFIKYAGEKPNPDDIKMSGTIQIGKKIMVITGPKIVNMEKVESLEDL
jgi:hypothetical protein